MDGEIVSVHRKCDVKHGWINNPTYMDVIIYKIVCKDPSVTETYVGQTRKFDQRKFYHELSCETCETKLYKCIRLHGGWSNWDMISLREYVCNHIESLKMEWYWWRELSAELNSVIPGIKHIRKDTKRPDFETYIQELELECRRY